MLVLVVCTNSGHEIKSNGSKESEKKSRNNIGKFCYTVIIPGVIKTKGLQHTPEPVAEMNSKHTKGEKIEKAIEEIAQKVFYQFGNLNVRWINTEAEYMYDEEEKNKENIKDQ